MNAKTLIFSGLRSARIFLVITAVAAWTTCVQGAALVDLSFNEGEGTNITDLASSWEGYLHINEAANASTDEPFLQDESPSPVAGDRSVLIRGNGYLAATDTNAVLAFGPDEAFTMEAWVYLAIPDPAFLNENEGVITYGGAYSLGLRSGRLAFTMFGVATNEPPLGILVPADTWHHVAAAFDPGEGVTLYLDGVPTFVANTNRVEYYFNNILFLGAERGDNNILANLDRLRVHRGLLTQAQLDSVAGTPKPVFANTLAAYSFDSGSLPAPNAAPPVMPAYPSIEFLENAPWVADDPAEGANDFAIAFDGLWRATLPETEESGPIIPAETTNYTVEAYVKLPENLPSSRMVLLEYGGDVALQVSINPDGTLHTSAPGKRELMSSAAVPLDGGWHHIAVVHESGTEMRFFVDGQLEDTASYTQGPGSGGVPGLIVGMDQAGEFRFAGSLDRVRISDAALTPEEFDLLEITPPGDEPALEISRTGNEVTVSWPVAAGDFVLETSLEVGPDAEWTVVTHQTSGAEHTYTTEATGEARFFRLRGN